MIECRSISKTLSARSYTTVLPAVARRSPATSTPPENLKARIVVASVGCHVFCGVPACGTGFTSAGASRPLLRSSVRKSLAVPEKFWSNATGERSITDPYAGDSAWIGWDQPCAFFLKGPLCRAAKCPANVALHHRLVLVPTEPVLPVFGCARALKNLRAKYWKASRAPPVHSKRN